MRRLIRFPFRSRARIARDVDEEFRFHIDMRVGELIARGLTPDAARAEALHRFGDLHDAREYCRTMDERSTTARHRRDWLTEIGSDIRFAARQLRRAPGFSAIAVLTLALGIGATTAIFSVVNRMLLNPIPYADGDRIVSLVRTNREGNLFVTPTAKLVEAWRSGVRSLEAVTTYGWQEVRFGAPGEEEEVEAGKLSATTLSFLGVRPALGRAFLPEETQRGASKVVAIGYGLWQRRFAGERDVIGRTLRVEGEPHTIVGVLPRDFTMPFMDGEHLQLWLPLEDDPDGFAHPLAKIRPGITREQVDRELTAVVAALGEQSPEYREWLGATKRPEDYVGKATQDTLFILLGAVGMVLLIACANVANLLLARASTRERELAVRSALGAGRWRLARQMLTESAMIALAGGALGLLVAQRALDIIIALRPERLAALDEVRLDPLVLTVAMALTIATGLLFGLAPALFAAGRDIGDALKSATRAAAGHVHTRRSRSALVVAEVSLSVVLLVGAGLLVRTMVEMQRADIGFDAAGLASARIQLPADRYPTREQRLIAYGELHRRFRTIPGVTGATWAMGVPPRTGVSFGQLEIEGRVLAGDERVTSLSSQFAAPEYFALMRLPLAAGRPFSGDTTRHEVIVNETMARRYWPGRSAIGGRFRLNEKGAWRTVVGVAQDVTIPYTGRQRSSFDLQAYFPFTGDFEDATIILRTDGVMPGLAAGLARETGAVDPGIRVRDVATVEATLAKQLAGPRFNMALLLSFAVIALMLAAIGLYGVIAYSVTQRTREMGIRVALGAGRHAVLRLVLSQGARLTLVGVVVGLAGAVAATRLMQSLLYGVTPLDPTTFAAVALLLGTVALVASYFPARRATRVDPVVALRAE